MTKHLRRPQLIGAICPAVVIVAALVTMRSPQLQEAAAGAASLVTLRAVLWTLPGQIAATLLCAGALCALRPGVSFAGCIASRLLRDAAGNLFVLWPGLGEVIGARALILAGGRAHAAVAASLVDVLLETATQIPFACLAVLIVPSLIGRPSAGSWLAPMSAAVAVAVAGGLALATWRRGRPPIALFSALAGWRLRAQTHITTVVREIAARRARVRLAAAFHLLAWAMGGIQVWLAAGAVGTRLTLFDAIVLESSAYALRALMFVVPAGLGVQEAGFVLAGAALGLTPAQGLGLSLVLRLRDLVFGCPVLLLWPVMEWRRAPGGID